MLGQTTRFEPDTPQNKRGATHSVPRSTPTSAGMFILPKLRPDPYESSEYDHDSDERCISRDLENYRVFVDMDVFMKHVLHIPENWEELWAGTIGRIKQDPVFSLAIWEHTRWCGAQGIREDIFYKPLVDMINAILEICESSSDTKSRNPLHRPKDAKKALYGM